MHQVSNDSNLKGAAHIQKFIIVESNLRKLYNSLWEIKVRFLVMFRFFLTLQWSY